MKLPDWLNPRNFRILFIGYLIAVAGMFFYSYTQVDLNLTLSRMSVWQTIEKAFQYVGYYQRPLSAGLYVALLALFFSLYVYALRLVSAGKITAKQIWIIVAVLLFLVFSYPAFSYDIFNYMFDAKTVLVYRMSPYAVRPLQFTGVDPYLTFLHWTHVPSVYPPFWIFLTGFPYLLGFGVFLLTLWNFKLLMAAGYLLAAWSVHEILKHSGYKNPAVGLALFALNPLVIIESLVSSHNDIVMMGLGAFAYLLFVQGKRVWSWGTVAMSVGIKFMTVGLIPLFLVGWRKGYALMAMAAVSGLFLYVTHREVMPWYFLWLLPFIAILPHVLWLQIISVGISAGLLLRYAPFLYMGDWNPPVPMMKLWLSVIPIAISVICAVFVTAIGRRTRA